MEGQPYSWQLGETADAFVKRVPPRGTSADVCEWIWAANPYRNPRDKSAVPRVAAFKDRGAKLLADSSRKRDEIQEKGRWILKISLSLLSKMWQVKLRWVLAICRTSMLPMP